ncbi:DUF4831 family protein [Parabacteroides sp. FAFU027]|uniref:DUF4831 family protein n=1 Tax=Parabacteroides sp. FAFU027 TaxID=2922715 RepID=UPI001FB01EC1|nr:DUF4831 family protein [Parabacteroides sp. FAFU027]
MKKILFLCGLLFSLSAYSQTEWQKLSATKASDFGLSYSLPKTVLYFDVEYTKTSLKAGPYFRYAEKLLGINNPIVADSTFFTIDKVAAFSHSTIDKKSACMVQFKSSLPYIILNSDGILCAVNTNPDTISVRIPELPQNQILKAGPTRTQNVLSEEALASGSVAKMAEVAAKQIFKLRESRTDLLAGDAENAPKDGEGLKVLFAQLDEQESSLMALFMGTTQVEKQFARIKYIPTGDEVNHQVLFRFSKHLGLVEKENLSGGPVYIDLKATDRKQFMPDPKQKAKEKKGLIYNIPGKGEATVSYDNKPLLTQEFTMTQFGIQANFPTNLFNDKKAPGKVILNPETGAIISMMQ